MFQIKDLANTDTATWPGEFVKVYLMDQVNETCIGKLDSELVVNKTEDSNKDIENACSISVPGNVSLLKTLNLPGKLKLCVCAMVMLSDNIGVSDRLIKVHLTHLNTWTRDKSHFVVQSGFAGNSLKDRKLRGELKECVSITARAKRFPLKKRKSTITADRKQFPLILGHAITVHKSERNTLTYMQGDLNPSICKKTATGKNDQQCISQVSFIPYFPMPKVVIRFYC